MWEAGERPPRAVSVPVAEVLQQFGNGLEGACDPGFEYTPGGAWGTIYDTGNQPRLLICKQIPYLLYYPSNFQI